jgi:hypothetical protein
MDDDFKLKPRGLKKDITASLRLSMVVKTELFKRGYSIQSFFDDAVDNFLEVIVTIADKKEKNNDE